MGLESLFAFTLLGGMAAGAYVFETCFARKRSGNRPWLLPLVVVALFAIGMIAASTHVQSIPRAMGSLTSGTVNFASGMVREVAVSGVFFVLALIDMIIAFVKKDSPFALRVVTAVVAVACMVLMGTAYTDVFGNPVWTNAPATVLSFVAGDLAMGLGLCTALSCPKSPLHTRWLLLTWCWPLVWCLRSWRSRLLAQARLCRWSAWWLRLSLLLR